MMNISDVRLVNWLGRDLDRIAQNVKDEPTNHGSGYPVGSSRWDIPARMGHAPEFIEALTSGNESILVINTHGRWPEDGLENDGRRGPSCCVDLVEDLGERTIAAEVIVDFACGREPESLPVQNCPNLRWYLYCTGGSQFRRQEILFGALLGQLQSEDEIDVAGLLDVAEAGKRDARWKLAEAHNGAWV